MESPAQRHPVHLLLHQHRRPTGGPPSGAQQGSSPSHLHDFVCDQDSSVLRVLKTDSRLTHVHVRHDPGHTKNNVVKDLHRALGKSKVVEGYAERIGHWIMTAVKQAHRSERKHCTWTFDAGCSTPRATTSAPSVTMAVPAVLICSSEALLDKAIAAGTIINSLHARAPEFVHEYHTSSLAISTSAESRARCSSRLVLACPPAAHLRRSSVLLQATRRLLHLFVFGLGSSLHL